MSTSSLPTPDATPEPAKKLSVGKIVKWLLGIDLVGSVVLTVVQIVVFDALAKVADYTGFGKVLGMIGFGIVAFFTSLLTVTIWMAVGIFFICFFGFLFFVLPHWVKGMKSPQQTNGNDARQAATADAKRTEQP